MEYKRGFKIVVKMQRKKDQFPNTINIIKGIKASYNFMLSYSAQSYPGAFFKQDTTVKQNKLTFVTDTFDSEIVGLILFVSPMGSRKKICLLVGAYKRITPRIPYIFNSMLFFPLS